MEIPYKQLSSDALRGIVEEFITRDGTDYGREEVPLEQKIDAALGHIRRGTVASPS